MKKLTVTVIVMAAFVGLWVTAGTSGEKPVSPSAMKLETATFAGGCFWCMEPPFEKLDGVNSVISGFTGGSERNPSYKEVSRGETGHTEAVQIKYDSSRITYRDLLEVFWRSMDPTDSGGQFADRGLQYRTGIFYHSDEQRRQAEASKKALAASKRFKEPIVTPILEAGAFYPAEKYHQDYYKKNTLRYKFYRRASGRDAFLKKAWGDDLKYTPAVRGAKGGKMEKKYVKPSDRILRGKLTHLQYRVTQEDGTERAFSNEYWDNKKAGIYVDIVSGEPLFSSRDKFKSGTGWPSFTRPLVSGNIVEKKDASLFRTRIEVRSKYGDSHLGHVFADGPKPTGLRYCINSASLRFIAASDLEKEGYEEFADLFE